MKFPSLCYFVSSCLILTVQNVHAATSDPPSDWPLVFVDDFEKGDASAWEPTDPAAWKIAEDHGGHVYSLFTQSKYESPVRSPINYSLVKDRDVSDFVLEVKLRSTTKDYKHRDMCVIFGYQDRSHFYYVHLALESDAHANSIFLVNGTPRVSVAKTRNNGIAWGETYHTVRVVRKASSGEISVYFDDMEKPVMTAVDQTFIHGRVGVGSFDDTGNVDDFKLWGKAAGGK